MVIKTKDINKILKENLPLREAFQDKLKELGFYVFDKSTFTKLEGHFSIESTIYSHEYLDLMIKIEIFDNKYVKEHYYVLDKKSFELCVSKDPNKLYEFDYYIGLVKAYMKIKLNELKKDIQKYDKLSDF